MDVKRYLKIQEGEKKRGGIHHLYKCPKGKWTIGYGHNLEANGITDGIANLLLEHDIHEVEKQARRLVSNFEELNEVRQCVVVSLIFQLGSKGFEGFRRTRKFIEMQAFGAAGIEMADSDWYRDLKKWAKGGWTRGDRECEMMIRGEWV